MLIAPATAASAVRLHLDHACGAKHDLREVIPLRRNVHDMHSTHHCSTTAGH